MAYRVLIAQFKHETNTFSKLPTTLEDYRKHWLIEGEAMVGRFKGTRNEIGGYIDSIAKYDWQPVWGAAANATPSGTLTRETWETIRDMILGATRKAGKLGGICLSLHGAMKTTPRGRCSRRCAASSGPMYRSWQHSTCMPMPR
jgi:microcystin degradation protein MlrC